MGHFGGNLPNPPAVQSKITNEGVMPVKGRFPRARRAGLRRKRRKKEHPPPNLRDNGGNGLTPPRRRVVDEQGSK